MYKYLILIIVSYGLSSCDFDDQLDPNNPSIVGILENANVAQLNNLVIGSLSQMRPELNTFYDVTGDIGREIYRFSGSDPRWVSDLLSGSIDNNAFYTTRTWGDRYQTIKNCNLLIEAATNSVEISSSELEAYLGFAKTIQAFEYIVMMNQQYTHFRIQVSDPDNLGPLVTRAETQDHIVDLLNQGASHLTNSGTEFPFVLTAGFEFLDEPNSIEIDEDDTVDPNEFSKFNSALLARISINQENWSTALLAVSQSFGDLSGGMTDGVYYSFSSSTGDQLNPVFLPLDNTGENRLAHPSYLLDIRAGDIRRNKVAQRSEDPGPVTESDLIGTHDVNIYPTNTAWISMVKNEELLLIAAEAYIKLGQFNNAAMYLSAVSSAYALGDYTGALDESSLMDELVYQRRYSLFYEGHRWNDMIRWGRTSDLPLDRAGDLIHTEFPVPFDDAQIP